MKKIVVLNQPINNRGDQAAHKSFMELLKKNGDEISVVFMSHVRFLGGFYDGISGVNYVCVSPKRGEMRLRTLVEKNAVLTRIFSILSPMMKKVKTIIRSADIVVCAPGGVCMGAYKSWRHVNILDLAVRNNSNVAIWGRSIGPFNDKTADDRRFSKISLSILERMGFISLRDMKSQKLAKELGVSCCPTIDTAFASVPRNELPPELKYLEKEEYMIFVPNKLYEWHPYFKDLNPRQMDHFFSEIMKGIVHRGFKILMLPQLFNCGLRGDIYYFEKLKAISGLRDEVIILPEKYDSDTQQAIIRYAKMLVGARYHSVIFAINNEVPFLCLSYEHKMHDTLGLLGLTEYSVDLYTSLIEADQARILERIDSALKNYDSIKDTLCKKRMMAEGIVLNAFRKFQEYAAALPEKKGALV